VQFDSNQGWQAHIVAVSVLVWCNEDRLGFVLSGVTLSNYKPHCTCLLKYM